MAGSKLSGKVKASTIVEVLVSMVIIVAVFGIAMMIYTNVLRMSLSVKKLRAQAILRQVMLTAENTPGNTTQSLNSESFRIEQEVKPYNGDIGLTELHLTAYDENQQKVAELQKVIINQP